MAINSVTNREKENMHPDQNDMGVINVQNFVKENQRNADGMMSSIEKQQDANIKSWKDLHAASNGGEENKERVSTPILTQ